MVETVFHLRSAEYVLGCLADGTVHLDFNASVDWPALRVRALARRYCGRQPDLADLCLIRMSELHPQHIVLTTDRADFRVYRRNGREIIPALFPPAG